MNKKDMAYLKSMMRYDALDRLEELDKRLKELERYIDKGRYPVEEFHEGPVIFEPDFVLGGKEK